MSLSQKTVKELREKCKDLNIKNYSNKKKSLLIELINTYENNTNENNTNSNTNENNTNSNTENKINMIPEYDLEKIIETLHKLLKTKKFVDLFCGIGGFHQALTTFGLECLLACDIDKACRAVYKDNYGIDPIEDVRKINPEELEDFSILCGGFPCQSFSNGGKKKAFNDERGLLFDEIMRIAKVKQPEFMFLENVKHIRKVDDGNVLKYILDKLDKNNYYVKTFDISPHQFGIPQQRERVYFVCIHKSIYHNKTLDLIIPKNKPIKLESFLEETPDPKYNVNGDILNVLDAWETMIQKFPKGEKISPTILVNEFYKSYTEEEFNDLPNWKKDYIKKNKPLYIKYKKHWDTWYKKNESILDKREIYAKLEWQTGLIKENDSIFNHFIQLRQSGIRVKKAHYFPTLVAISQIPIYGKQKRYITPRECARLQSFPDTFKIDPSDKNSYKQFGNCVNVDNVRTIMKMTFQSFV